MAKYMVTTHSDAAESAIKQLSQLLNQRLQLMQEVAHYKYHYQLPIHSPEVEHGLLREVEKAAQLYALDPKQLLLFSQALFDLGVQLQIYWCERWSKTSATPAGVLPDLEGDLRPKLKAMTLAIIQQMAIARHLLAQSTQGICLEHEAVDARQKQALLKALQRAVMS